MAATLLRVSAEGLGTALVLLVLERTGRAASAGFLLSAAMLPYVLAGPVLGHLLDRTHRPRLFVTAFSVAYTLALGLLFVVAGRAPWPLALAAAVLAGCAEPIVVSLTGLLPRIVLASRLTRAYGLEAATYNVAAIAGPGLAAGLTGWAGAPTAAAAVLGIAAVGAAMTLFLRIPPPPGGPKSGPQNGLQNGPKSGPENGPESGPKSGPETGVAAGVGIVGRRRSELGVLTGGFLVLIRNPVLRASTMGTTVAFLGIGGLPVIAVLFAEHLGMAASAGGRLLAAFAVGALAGSLASARWLPLDRAEHVVALGLLVLGAALALTAVVPVFPLALAGFVLAGFVDGPLFAATLALRQRESPADRLGQVNTTGGSLKIGAAALGAALTAVVAGRIGAVGLMLGMAAIQIVGAALCAAVLRRGLGPVR